MWNTRVKALTRKRSRSLLMTASVLAALMSTSALAEPFAYVSNYSGNSVSVIDLATNVVGTTIPNPGNPYRIAVSADAQRIYVANETSNAISIIDAKTNAVIGTPIAVGGVPHEIAITPDGTRAYVALAGLTTIAVIDTATRTLLAPVSVNAAFPNSIAFSPDGKRAYVAAGFGAQVIDTTTNTVTATTAPLAGTGTNMRSVAVSPDGKRLYLASVALGDFGLATVNTLSVVDTATNALIVNVDLPGLTSIATDVAVSPDGKSAYVTDSKTGLVWVVDTATNTLAASIPTPAGAEGIAFSPDGKRALVVEPNANSVAVIDTATRTLLPAAIAVGALPKGIAIAPLPPIQPFASFTANLSITSRFTAFGLTGQLKLGTTSNGIKPLTEPVKITVGPYSATIPAGSFRTSGRSAIFYGTINGARLGVTISPSAGSSYTISVAASGANLAGVRNPVPVNLSIGDDAGATSVRARF